MGPLVSIVIPTFNVAQYLEKCIKSIRNQPYKNLEIILVNDGSTDNSGILCESIAARDSRITTVHKENGGLSSARNTGLDLATGKYIVFIDPDDQVETDYFLTLIKQGEESMCDVVISGFQTSPDNQQTLPSFTLQEVMSGKELILSSSRVHSSNDLCFVWRYLYKLDFLRENNIRFNEKLKIVEDAIFNLEVLLKSSKTLAIPDILYTYTVDNSNSLMRSKYKPHLEASLNIQYKRRKELSYSFGLMENENYRRNMAYYHINNMYRLLTTNLRNSNEENKRESLKKIINFSLVRDSVNEIGIAYKCTNLKEYLFYLSLKYRIYPILLREFTK